jgi:hypothetical protein
MTATECAATVAASPRPLSITFERTLPEGSTGEGAPRVARTVRGCAAPQQAV